MILVRQIISLPIEITAKRKSPTGACAYGIPRYVYTAVFDDSGKTFNLKYIEIIIEKFLEKNQQNLMNKLKLPR